MLLKFDEYINEKMGVAAREVGDINENDISRIANSFMDKISMDPKKDYETTETFFDKKITIRYEPKYFGDIKPSEGDHPKGVGGYGFIAIYVGLTDNNYLDIKYAIVHELVHILQTLRDDNIKNFNVSLRRNLIYPSDEQLYSDLGDKSLSSFLYMMYRNVPYEIYAWSNQGYAEAFKYKLDNPDKSNHDVVKHVLKTLKMSNEDLNKSLDSIKNNEMMFVTIVGAIVGQFSELSKNTMEYYRYFDKSIFELPVIKTIRKEVKSLISDDYKRRSFDVYVSKLIDNHMDELKKHKNAIIDSFIKSFEYWFNKSKAKLGKAIQLGIDDSMEKSFSHK